MTDMKHIDLEECHSSNEYAVLCPYCGDAHHLQPPGPNEAFRAKCKACGKIFAYWKRVTVMYCAKAIKESAVKP